MEEIGLQEFTEEQMETICSLAEEAAREYILTRVPPKRVETLNITVETSAEYPVTLTVELELELSPLMRNLNVQKLADEAVKEAFAKAEKYMRELKCHLQK